MECQLSSFLQSCEYSLAGIKTFYLGNFSDIDTITYDSNDKISGFTMQAGKYLYLYDQVGNFVSADESMTDTNNGYPVTQTVQFDLAKMDFEKRNRVIEMTHEDLVAITVDWNGKIFIFGENNGLRLDSSTSNTGRERGDFNGYNVILRGTAKEYAREMDITEVYLESIALPQPPAVIDCTAYSALTWGATSVSPAYFGDLAQCLYSDFL